jgi:hypothetical protein
MKPNLKGRLRNTKVHLSEALMPLFECIMNSIQSIEEAKVESGSITVSLLRDGQTLLPLESGSKDPINSIEITDNGVGFTTSNYDSFNTEDSDYKFTKGGKGVGRFTWLVVFNRVHVDSFYSENGKNMHREFDFLPEEPGIHYEKLEELSTIKKITRVRLNNIHSKYSLNKKAVTIAERIFEHFFFYLLLPDCPKITLHDGEEIININQMIGDESLIEIQNFSFEIRGRSFEVKLIKLFGAQEHPHKLFLCANGREVESKHLSSFLPDLPDGSIPDESGNRDFICLATITSGYFDENINQERTMLLIPDSENLFDSLITKQEIYVEFKKIVQSFLEPNLVKFRSEKKQRIQNFVETQAPQYRALLNEKYSTYIDEMPYAASSEKLESELHKIKFKIEVLAKTRVRELVSRTVESEGYSKFQEESTSLLSEVSELSKSALAEYIVHRKLILALFEKKLRVKDDDKYELEKTIHEVIFPLRTESDEIDYEKHNLWMIDERLSYHKYLASDIPFDQMTEIESQSKNRTDIVIFNGSSALVDDGVLPYGSIVIIEFKRPMRKGYPEDDMPVTQVFNYIRDIKSGKALDKYGRQMFIKERPIPFFCYILCDITEKVASNAADSGLTLTPDSQGYFGYNSQHGAYVEIISYDKLLNDSKKRNQILFDKLNI